MTVADKEVQVFSETRSSADLQIRSGEIVIGSIAGIDAQGQALVSFPENPSSSPVVAMSTLGVTSQLIGRQVALLFANGNPQAPVIMGIIHSPLQDLLASYEVGAQRDTDVLPEAAQGSRDVVVVDGRRIVIEGREEIVLKCGDASITLTKSGKIIIRGKYLVNRSSGVNRILGGSVQIN